MRPKSSATVVVTLPATADVSSMPIDFSVISASVTSGSISEMEPTKVVLPTPKPPLTTTLTATGVSCDSLERPDTIPDPFDQPGGDFARLFLHLQVAVGDQGSDDDAGDAEGGTQAHRDVRHRHRLLAELDDAPGLEPERGRE